MSIIAKLHIEDKIFTILKFRYGIEQNSDYNGYPSAKPIGGHWSIILESTKDPIFYEWMVAENTMKDIQIVLSPSSLNAKTRTIKLYDVFCIKYLENFDGINSKPMSTLIEISPAIMEDSGTKIFEKYWKVSNPFDNNVAPTVIGEEEEEEIIEAYYEDIQGNRIDKPKIGTTVNLILKTQNAVGKTVEIDLSDNERDFMYNDTVLENDLLKLQIKSNNQKEELTVIAQNH